MSGRSPYWEFKQRVDAREEKSRDRMRSMINNLHNQLGSVNSDLTIVLDSAELREAYRTAELAYFEEVYGLRNTEIYGFDPNWDRHYRREAKGEDEDTLLALHFDIQNQRMEVADDYWNHFLMTDSAQALQDYVKLGGEINQVTRNALATKLPEKHYAGAFRRYETYLQIKEVIEASNHKHTIGSACQQLAEQVSLRPSDVASNKRKFEKHLKQLAVETGLPIEKLVQ